MNISYSRYHITNTLFIFLHFIHIEPFSPEPRLHYFSFIHPIIQIKVGVEEMNRMHDLFLFSKSRDLYYFGHTCPLSKAVMVIIQSFFVVGMIYFPTLIIVHDTYKTVNACSNHEPGINSTSHS